jgi:O-antigen/teichoic acid export membrane protein
MDRLQKKTIQQQANGHQSKLLKVIAKGSSLTVGGVVFGKATLFVFQVIITRLFGKNFFGLLVIGLAIVEFFRIFSSFGLPRGGMRFLSLATGADQREKYYGILGTSLFIPGLSSLIFGVILYFVSEKIALIWFKDPALVPVLQTLSFSLPFTVILGVGVSLSRGFNTTVYAVITENVLLPCSRILLFLIFFLWGFGFISVLYAVVVSFALGMALILIFLKQQVVAALNRKILFKDAFRKWKEANQKSEMILYSMPLFLTGMSAIILHSVDVVMIGKFLDSSFVGVYGAAAAVAATLTSLLMVSLNSIFAPLIATQFGNRNFDNIQYLYIATTRWMFYISVPVTMMIMIARGPIMLIYGKPFVETGAVVLLILSAGHLFNCITGGVGNILSMTGHPNKELITNVFVVFINISLNLILIPRYGVVGAAVATAASQLAVNTIRIAIVYRIYSVHPMTMKMGILSLVALLLIGLSSGIKTLYHQVHYDILFAFGSAGIFILLVFLFMLQKEDYDLLHDIKNKILKHSSRRKIKQPA